MFVEYHILQNFAPSCLNRDDTNAPKDCMFGGVRRARISSQCIKRAIRVHVDRSPSLKGNNSLRTRKMIQELARQLAEEGHDREKATTAAANALKLIGFKQDDKGMTKYLLPLGKDEIAALKTCILDNWDELTKTKAKLAKNARENLEKCLDGKRVIDLAMFGRMLADLPEKNIDAACQVAHAISTHRVDMEMDFYTAVDDLVASAEEEAGAAMMGITEFNSACFYRYALVDWDKLVENLGSDSGLARRALEAFLRASIEAIPTGKQNAFAAQNPPSFILAVARESSMPWSLANAFEQPVWANGKGLVEESIRRLADYWERLNRMYSTMQSDQQSTLAWAALDPPEEAAETFGKDTQKDVAALIKTIVDAVAGGEEAS